MKRVFVFSVFVLMAVGLMAATLGGCEQRSRTLRLGGGPYGGTFQLVGEGLVEVLQPHHPGYRFMVERSGGSVANLRALEREQMDLGLVYAADFWVSGGPDEKPVPVQLKNALPAARLFGAVAQLAVLERSRITRPEQLRGARVAVGNPGSGAARAAERYFRALGIWEQIVPVYLGYDMAVSELLRGNVVAVWEMVGVPSASFEAALAQRPLRLINLRDVAGMVRFFELNPYYRPVDIASGTYEGQQQAVSSFEDSALLVAGRHLSRDMVWRILEGVYSEEGVKSLRRVHPVLADFSAAAALTGINIPLHPGAAYFWRQQGRELPAALLPEAVEDSPLVNRDLPDPGGKSPEP